MSKFLIESYTEDVYTCGDCKSIVKLRNGGVY